MPHLRLVPPLPADPAAAPAIPTQRAPYEDREVALAFFQAASGVCLCRDCSKLRHPAYGAR